MECSRSERSEESLRARDGMQDGLRVSYHFRGNHTSSLRMTKCRSDLLLQFNQAMQTNWKYNCSEMEIWLLGHSASKEKTWLTMDTRRRVRVAMPQPTTGNIKRTPPIAEHALRKPCSRTKADPTESRTRRIVRTPIRRTQIMEGDKDPMRVKVNPPIEVSEVVEVSTTQENKNAFVSKPSGLRWVGVGGLMTEIC